MDHHRTAVQKIHKHRAAGKPATVRHRRFDGTASIAVHSLRVSGTPARTPAVLADPTAATATYCTCSGSNRTSGSNSPTASAADITFHRVFTDAIRCGTTRIEIIVK